MKRTTEAAMAPAEYLKKPYGRTVVPESDGTFRAEIIEFPGCIAVGDTAAEALGNLEDVAASWLEATIARGQHIPEPIENTAFSGKLVVRLPKSLHKRAARMAAQDGVSLNQFIVSSIAEQVGRSYAHPMLSQLQSVLSANICSFPASQFWALQLITSGQQVTHLPMKRLEKQSHA
jgi:antitoxin HicB